LSLQRAHVPVIVNSSALPLIEPQDIREELVRHLTSPVRWVESISRMIAMGITTFVEVGPKDVLCGLIKRIDGGVTVVRAGTEADIAALEVR
jgi:[acyl-carrier-protein] S-malonyltransferase